MAAWPTLETCKRMGAVPGAGGAVRVVTGLGVRWQGEQACRSGQRALWSVGGPMVSLLLAAPRVARGLDVDASPLNHVSVATVPRPFA